MKRSRPGRERLQLWGGIECTVNRCGDDYIDQLELTGHDRRESDIDMLASLGVSMMRYPVLWERTAPNGLGSLDSIRWEWSDSRLDRLRALGVTPIVGMMHHGSGPPYTSLLDPRFPELLAEYAGACARRYPWMEWVTPVNEPLTTARFSGLYGHWYPHHRDDRSFVRMLLNQCEGTRAAMREIRAVCPGAKLVQTEDLGHTHSTQLLGYQAWFENQRRWLTFDLLCGMVDREHEMYEFLRKSGATKRELDRLAADPCPPDILGIDYYVTSERYLDENTELFPPATHGVNQWHTYADVEVARTNPSLRRGLQALLMETWERYGRPIAVTECYLSCVDVHEQLRWLEEQWHAAQAALDAGCDVRAVTAWALLGTRGWDNLVRSRTGNYDAGAFDVQRCSGDGTPCETPLAEMIRSLASGGWYEHDALGRPGWWQEADRFAGDIEP